MNCVIFTKCVCEWRINVATRFRAPIAFRFDSHTEQQSAQSDSQNGLYFRMQATVYTQCYSVDWLVFLGVVRFFLFFFSKTASHTRTQRKKNGSHIWGLFFHSLSIQMCTKSNQLNTLRFFLLYCVSIKIRCFFGCFC